MGYPVAYRTALARSYRAPSFQPEPGGPGGAGIGVPRQLPVAANDNLLAAANDNLLAAEETAATAAERRVALALVGRGLARFVPYLGAALTAYELWKALNANVDTLPSYTVGYAVANYTMTECRQPGIAWIPGTTIFRGGVAGACLSYVSGGTVPPLTNPVSWAQIEDCTINGLASPLRLRYAYTRVKSVATQVVNPSVQPASMPAPYMEPVHALPWPSLRPALTPITGTQPAPVPQPIPWEVLPGLPLDVFAPPGLQLEQGYDLGRFENNDQFVDSPPVGAIDLATGAAVTPEHRFEPPGRNTREKKFSTGAATAGTLIRAIYDAATEAVDLLDSFYNAIDGVKKPKPIFYRGINGKWFKAKTSPIDKAVFIGQHLDKLNWDKVWRNVANNEIKDRFYGTIGKKLGQGAQAIHNAGYGSFSRAPQPSRMGAPTAPSIPDIF